VVDVGSKGGVKGVGAKKVNSSRRKQKAKTVRTNGCGKEVGRWQKRGGGGGGGRKHREGHWARRGSWGVNCFLRL